MVTRVGGDGGWSRRAVACLLPLLLLPTQASAECASVGSPCYEYKLHPVVFQGLVVRMSPVDSRQPEGAWTPQIVTLKVERAWKGLGTVASVDLYQGTTLDLDYAFTVGERYLIHAWPSGPGGQLRAEGCGRTRPLSHATAALEFLETLSRPGTGGWIHGSVELVDRDGPEMAVKPFGQITIVLTGRGVRRETRTDERGRWSFDGLGPGSYKVTALMPEGFRVDWGGFFYLPPDRRSVTAGPPSTATLTIDRQPDCADTVFWCRRSGDR
jgi:hypothetical protein